MKKFIVTIAVIIATMSLASAQDRNTDNASYTREGNSFVQGKRKATKRASKDQPTEYTWTDSRGNTYPIVLHTIERGERAGRTTACVMKVSAKTGKEYRHEIPNGEAIADEILGRKE